MEISTAQVQKNDKTSELVRLREENEKLESQLNSTFNLMAMLNELTFSLDLDEVYRNILDILVVSVGSNRHSIALFDNGGVLKVVISKFGDDEVDYEHAIAGKGVVKKVMETKSMFVSANGEGIPTDDVMACIPLLVKEEVIGVVIIHELLSHKKNFTSDDSDLFEILSTHAGYSLLAAKTYEKTRQDVEDKDREITKLNDISALVSSAVDIDDVLNTILDAIVDLLVCDMLSIFLYNEEDGVLVLRHSMGGDPDAINSYSIKPGEGISGKSFLERKPILMKDMAREVRYPDLVKTEEARFYAGSVISVPIMIQENPIGVITVSKFKGGHLLDVPEKKLLTTLSAQAAVGIDRARMQEVQEKELVNVSNLFIATNQLHSTVDLDEIYTISKELLVDFIGAKVFFLMLKDPSETELTIVLSKGIDSSIVNNATIQVGKGIVGKVVESGESFIFSENQRAETVCLDDENFSVYACIPLRLENKIAGAIVINELLSQKNAFVKFDRDLFDLMTQHTATAILRAQLFAKTEERSSSSIYDLSRLLTINYDLKKSVHTTLTMVDNNIEKVKKIVVLLGSENKMVDPLAYRGYSAQEIEHISEIQKKQQKEALSLPLLCDKKQVGILFVHLALGQRLTEKECEVLDSSANLISQFIYHDKNFQFSKELAVVLTKEKIQSKAIVKGVADGLLVTDIKGIIMQINPTIERLFGLKEKDVVGIHFGRFFLHDQIKKMLSDVFDKGTVEEKVEMTLDGNFVALTVKSSLVLDEKRKPTGVVTIMHDRTKELEAEKIKDEFLEKLKKISITDALTGLFNRRHFDERILNEFELSRRYKRALSFVMIDADHFKRVNDMYGHGVGDEVLKYLAQILQKGLRDVDFVARYGGEEFVLVLPETDAQNAFIVAERLRKTITRDPFSAEGHSFDLTVSFGISSFPADGVMSAEELLKNADQALYQAKERGRNRVEVFHG